MMKRIPWSGILLAAVVIGVLVNITLCYRYVRLVALAQTVSLQSRQLQGSYAMANQERGVMQKLALEALQYSRRNPAMMDTLGPFLPTFQTLGINVTSNAIPDSTATP